jgi:hypothetical protein
MATVVTAGFDDSHVAWAETFWVVPLDSVAVAVSWLVGALKVSACPQSGSTRARGRCV